MAQVLNGDVSPGDRVAYATREGNTAAIHLGTVEEIVTCNVAYKGEVPALRVRIETESRRRKKPEIRTVSILDRVVKI